MTSGDETSSSDAWVYLLAAGCGIAAGCADVAIDDLLFTALMVLSACIFLGLLRPRAPWRWFALVGVFVPLTELLAYLVLTVKARARAGVRIVSGVSPGHCGGLRRIDHAQGD